MRNLVAAVLFAALLASLAVTQSVRGQSAPPSAQALFTQAQAAFKSAGSAHVAVLVQSGSGAGATAFSGSLTGDISWKKPVSGHVAGTFGITGGVASGLTLPVAAVLNGNRVALQVGGQRWQCATLKVPARPGRTNVGGTKKPTVLWSPATAPVADTLDGVPVWRVHEAPRVRGKGAAAAKIPQIAADLYFAQSDSSLSRAVVTATGKSGPTAGTHVVTLDVSQYGETVQAQLPAACSSAAKARKNAASRTVKALLKDFYLIRQLGFAIL